MAQIQCIFIYLTIKFSTSAAVAVVSTRAVYKLLLEVSKKYPELKVSVFQATRGAAITGLASLIGGLVGGPIGGLAAGTLAGLLVYQTSEDYKSVYEILSKMTDEQKDKLKDTFLEHAKQCGKEITTEAALHGLSTLLVKNIMMDALKEIR